MQDRMPQEEAQEYIGKLQSGRAKLTHEATTLEQEVFSSFMETSKRIRELNTRKSDVEKQVEQLQQQVTGLGAAVSEVSGELGGYAKMLISAEWGRRKIIASREEAAKKAVEKDSLKGSNPKGTPEALPPPTPLPSKVGKN